MINPFLTSALLLCLLPFSVALAVYMYRVVDQRLPDKQRQALDQFVNMAVRAIWWLNGVQTDAQKEQLAIDAVKDLFIAFRLPVPNDAVIKVAVDAAILVIKQLSEQSLSEQSTRTSLPAVNREFSTKLSTIPSQG
jgi:hypothetical protein